MGDVIALRPALKAEARTIATLYGISSDGVANYTWSRMAGHGEPILDVGERRYAREDSLFSYRNCTLATAGDAVVGMLVAFPMEISDGEPSDPVLAPYARLEEPDSYYVCGMAVVPSFRGRGLGTRFLQQAEHDAAQRGLAKLSLIVFEANGGAKRLYDRHGYQVVRREPTVPHELIHYTGDALLMVKGL